MTPEVRECGYCGTEFTIRPYGWRRLYCTDSHRVMASRLRTAEAADETKKEAH